MKAVGHMSWNGWNLNPPLTVIKPGAVSFKVNSGAANLLGYVAEEFDRAVEDLELPGLPDEWGYSHRYIAGTRTWSKHAYGIAIDLNATRHPYGKRGTFSLMQQSAIRLILSKCKGLIAWGGDWRTPDDMHFEVTGTPSAVAMWTRPGSPIPPTGRATIQRGSKGPLVIDVQQVLNRWYPRLTPLVIDGDFGPATESRVKYFQARAGLMADGVVGPQTWAGLGF